MATFELPATDPLFAALLQLERLVLARGGRRTFCNMYCDNPWIETARFDVYLLPEPGGPHLHPQWNIRCDPTKTRFRRASIRRRFDAARTEDNAPRDIDFSGGSIRLAIDAPFVGDPWARVREVVSEALGTGLPPETA